MKQGITFKFNSIYWDNKKGLFFHRPFKLLNDLFSMFHKLITYFNQLFETAILSKLFRVLILMYFKARLLRIRNISSILVFFTTS